MATSLGLKTLQEAYNAKDTMSNNKVILNHILILDLDYLIISLKTAYLSSPKGKIKIRSTDCFLKEEAEEYHRAVTKLLVTCSLILHTCSQLR